MINKEFIKETYEKCYHFRFDNTKENTKKVDDFIIKQIEEKLNLKIGDKVYFLKFPENINSFKPIEIIYQKIAEFGLGGCQLLAYFNTGFYNQISVDLENIFFNYEDAKKKCIEIYEERKKDKEIELKRIQEKIDFYKNNS